MKLVSYNIQYGLGKDARVDLPRIARELEGADIIALQEVDRFQKRSGQCDQAAAISELLPAYFQVFAPALDLDGSERAPDGRVVNRRRQHGLMLLSRWPILSSRMLLLPRFRTYQHLNPQKGALEGLIDLPGGALRIYCVHLCYLNAEERLAQLDYLLPRLFAYRAEGGALTGPLPGGGPTLPLPESCVMLGDCNFIPDSAEYRKVVGAPDYFFGPIPTAHHLVDSWTRAGHAADEGRSWYDQGRRDAQSLRLDYLFVSPDLAEKVGRAWIDDSAEGSDHQPVWLELDC